MSILEQARKALAKVKARGNGHATESFPVVPGHDRNDINDRSAEPGECPGRSVDSPGYDRNDRNDQSRAVLVTAAADLPMVAAAVDESALVAADTETTGLDPRRDRVRLLTLATDRGVFVLDLSRLDAAPLFGHLAGRPLLFPN